MSFCLSRDLTRPRDQSDKRLYGYDPTKFGDHRPYGSGDIIVLVCHVISIDHVIKDSFDFMGRSPSR